MGKIAFDVSPPYGRVSTGGLILMSHFNHLPHIGGIAYSVSWLGIGESKQDELMGGEYAWERKAPRENLGKWSFYAKVEISGSREQALGKIS